jgi:hypothetical protein
VLPVVVVLLVPVPDPPAPAPALPEPANGVGVRRAGLDGSSAGEIDIAPEIQILRVYAMRVPAAKIGVPPLLAAAKNHLFCATGANRDRVGGRPERH